MVKKSSRLDRDGDCFGWRGEGREQCTTFFESMKYNEEETGQSPFTNFQFSWGIHVVMCSS